MSHDIFFDEETHTYLIDGEEVPSVTTVLNYMSDTEYKSISPSILEQASRRGTLVHEYTELIDYGAEPDEVEYEVVGYLKAYKDFLRDYKPNWLAIERQVYCEDLDYIGTVDRIGYINGKVSVVDIKTLASPTKMAKFTVSAQTRAYQNAYDAYGLEYMKRYALYLGKDGEYNLVDLDEYDQKYGYNSWGMFLICLETYKTIQKLKELKPIKKGARN